MSSEEQATSGVRFGLPFSTTGVIQAGFAATGLGICVVWAWHDGGFAPEEYLPGGLLLLALVCAACASAEVRARLSARPLPLVLFGLYVAWSYLSILWAQVPADALDGANRTLVYWLIFALFTGLGLSERLGRAVVLAWGVALAALGVIELIRVATATTSTGLFDQGRLSAPISYADGDAALFLSACLTLVVLASRRQANTLSRLVACVGAVVLAELSVLCQSRGSLIWFPCALLLYLAVTRSKLRAFAFVVLVGGCGRPRRAGPAACLLLFRLRARRCGRGTARSGLDRRQRGVGADRFRGADALRAAGDTLAASPCPHRDERVGHRGSRSRLLGCHRGRPPSLGPRRTSVARLHDEQGGRSHQESALQLRIRHEPL